MPYVVLEINWTAKCQIKKLDCFCFGYDRSQICISFLVVRMWMCMWIVRAADRRPSNRDEASENRGRQRHRGLDEAAAAAARGVGQVDSAVRRAVHGRQDRPAQDPRRRESDPGHGAPLAQVRGHAHSGQWRDHIEGQVRLWDR